MSKTNYVSRIDSHNVTSTKNLVQRHSGRCRRVIDVRREGVLCSLGILGLCAMVLSSPYDIPVHVPAALMRLCEHLYDPILIRTSICRTTRR